ncbi:MAG: porin family protein [Rubrivivax sp.]|nr:MAG: porin family protein [Rubrivivax sp.]
MKKIISAALLTLAMGGVHAQAYEGQAYLGSTIGLGQLEADCTGAVSCDTSGFGFKAYAGYKVTPNVAVEFNYLNFGKAEGSVLVGSSLLDLDIRTRAFTVNGAYHANFTPAFGGVVRFGLASVRTKATVGVRALKKDEAKPYLGLGLDYAVNKHLKAVAALDITEAELAVGGSGTVSLLSLGAQVEF